MRTAASSPAICPEFATRATVAHPDQNASHDILYHRAVWTPKLPAASCSWPASLAFLSAPGKRLLLRPADMHNVLLCNMFILSCPVGACSQLQSLCPGFFSVLHRSGHPRNPWAWFWAGLWFSRLWLAGGPSPRLRQSFASCLARLPHPRLSQPA